MPRDWKDEKGPNGLVDDEALIDLEERLGAGICVRDHGATGSGETADTEAFRDAVDALPSTGGVIYGLPGETYLLDSTVAITKPVIVALRGATIKRTTADPMFTFTGSVGEDAALTADAEKGTVTLKLDTAGISAGDILNLRSGEETGAPSGSTYGELVEVASVDSAEELTLKAPISRKYATADEARVAVMDLLEGCGIHAPGGELTQDEAQTEDPTKGYVRFQFCRAPRVTGSPTFSRMEEFAVEFDTCLAPYGNGHLRDMDFDEAKSRFAYGYVFRGATRDGLVEGTVESAQLGNTGGTTRGIPRHCRINLLGASGGPPDGHSGKSPIATHSDSEFCTLDIRIGAWGDIGCQVKGNDHTINVHQMDSIRGVGLFLVADSETVYPERCTINLPEISNVDEYDGNIGLGIVAQGVDHTIVLPEISDTDADSIRIAPSASGEPCKGTKVIKGVFRNYSRGNPSTYNAVRVKTGVEDVWVDSPNGPEAPEGARLVRFEGGEAGNGGCKLISPIVGPGMTGFGESEWFAVEGVKPGAEVLASAEELKPNPTKAYIEVTGTTTIKKLKKTFAGHIVVLNFTSTAKVLDGENLKLASEFAATANDTLTLICGGNNWYEVARSAI